MVTVVVMAVVFVVRVVFEVVLGGRRRVSGPSHLDNLGVRTYPPSRMPPPLTPLVLTLPP